MRDPNSKEYLQKQFLAMKLERETFDAHYKELARYINPRRGRFLTTDRNKGEPRHQEIINSHASQAHKVCTNGLLSGIMSPARPWFDLVVDDPDLIEFQPVKVYLEEVGKQINRVFNASNLYNMAPTMLGEMVLFGTGAMSHEDDFENVARFYAHTVGSYIIAQDENYRVNVFGREFEMTVMQMVKKFGLDNVSINVRRAYDQGDYHAWYPVWHLIEPNPEADARKPLAKYKAFRSCYFEPDRVQANDIGKFLRKSGYDEFPVYVPRWAVTAEDIYGTDCPGMTSLGDVKMLQIQEREMAKAIARQNTPPLHGPATLANKEIDLLPGGGTFYDAEGTSRLMPVYQPNADLNSMMADLQRTAARIDRAMFVDLFLAITSMEGIQPRNQLELTQRNQERLLQLGPVLERTHNEFLTPLVNRTFNQLVRASTDANGNWLETAVLPPPPPELQGREVEPRYISSIAIAQRAAGVGPIEQTVALVGGLMQAGILRDSFKIDGDQVVDEYAMRVGAPPKIIVPDETVGEQRQAAQQQANMAQMAEVAATGAKAGKDLMQAQAAAQGQGARR